MRAGAILIAGLIVFALLSLTDYTQTFALVEGGEGKVYEANPVADAWLQRFGWAGLAVFKAGTVLVFAGAAVLAWRRRPQAGATIAALGCAALLVVTNYSHELLARQLAAAEDPHGIHGEPALSGPINPDPETLRAMYRLPGWPPPPVPE